LSAREDELGSKAARVRKRPCAQRSATPYLQWEIALRKRDAPNVAAFTTMKFVYSV